MKIDIIKIGESQGIRLPKAILDQCGFGTEAELEVRGCEVVLKPLMRVPRAGWTNAFASAEGADLDDSERSISELVNAFDEQEWTWPEAAADK